ncbi:hypothetical protein GCM10009808_24940 [Microbacterium sediminicola]|uniref:HTH marR-type domain-containing protein n=1 Tax=Microbacterium sediminicola TaxID=415210 RepID=A0ABN2IJN5_9MICO
MRFHASRTRADAPAFTEVDLDRSTVADLVRRMERRGLIVRQRDAEDARRNNVTLTELGLAERQRLRPLVEAADAELTSPLSEGDLSALRRGLQGVLEGG